MIASRSETRRLRGACGDGSLTMRCANATACATTSPGDDLVEYPQLDGSLRRYRLAFEHELERRTRADQARQTLRSSGAGK